MSATYTFASYPLSAILLAIFTLVRITFAQSAPTLHYPLQSQLPPVARVNTSFLWTLLPDTFQSTASLSYAAQNMPEWLTFDATTLTFSGMPQTADIGTTTVYVQANASDYAVGTLSSFACLVVPDAAPVIQASVMTQLSSGGGAVYSSAFLQADGTVRIPEKWTFSIGFVQYTFTDPQDRAIYYTSYRTGTTSLPSWMSFDNSTVTYDGLAPTNENRFSIDLYGSDYYGYADVKQTFTIVIGSHSLILSQPLPEINATANEAISYAIPISGVLLDGSQISAANLSNVTVDLANMTFLSYDSQTRVISGALPSELPAKNKVEIPVSFTSAYNDTIISNVTLNIIHQLFSNGTIPTFNITGGKSFTDDLSSYLTSSTAQYTAAFTPSNASDWMKFDNTSKSISGTAPAIDGHSVTVNLTGYDASMGLTDSAVLKLNYIDPNANLQNSSHKGGLSRGAKIALGVIFGLLGLILLILLAIFLYRRHRKSKDQPVDPDTTLVSTMSEKGKGPTTPMTDARTSMSSNESDDRLDQAIAAAELSVAAALASETGNQNQRPRRMGLMDVFGKKSQNSADNLPTTQSGRSLKEIMGMTAPQTQSQKSMRNMAEAARRHEIIVVTDGDGYTYAPQSSHGHSSEEQFSRSDETRSSWDSQQSSSLFYSEDSVTSPVRGNRLAPQNETPRSIPRQRRDFLPYQPPASRAAPHIADSPPMPPSPMPPGGIRIVQTRHSSGSSSAESIIFDDDAPYNDPSHVANAAIATAHLEILDGNSSAASVHSTESRLSKPRLIAFTPERRGQRSDSLPDKQFSSQRITSTGMDSADNSRLDDDSLIAAANFDASMDASTEDADERYDSSLQRYSALSTQYQPPAELLEAAASPMVFFNDDADTTQGTVESVEREQALPQSAPGSAKSSKARGYTPAPSEPIRIHLTAGDPFHFTAQIHPPPPASIGSPGRDGPVRATYNAYTDYPNEPDFDGLALPPWLHFDARELEFWGSPSVEDSGSVAVRVVQRKQFSTPGSPSRRRASMDSKWGRTDGDDQIVGRFVLDVLEKA